MAQPALPSVPDLHGPLPVSEIFSAEPEDTGPPPALEPSSSAVSKRSIRKVSKQFETNLIKMETQRFHLIARSPPVYNYLAAECRELEKFQHFR